MTRRKLVRSLSEAAKAMPPAERRKFRQFLKGAAARPDDGLPAMTARQPISRPECGWYYGERCGCGDPSMRRGHAYPKPQQLSLFRL
jgi:hypothetical protein